MLSTVTLGKDFAWQWEKILYATEKKIFWWCKQNLFQNATFSQLPLFFFFFVLFLFSCTWLYRHTSCGVWPVQKPRSLFSLGTNHFSFFDRSTFLTRSFVLVCPTPGHSALECTKWVYYTIWTNYDINSYLIHIQLTISLQPLFLAVHN